MFLGFLKFKLNFNSTISSLKKSLIKSGCCVYTETLCSTDPIDKIQRKINNIFEEQGSLYKVSHFIYCQDQRQLYGHQVQKYS